MDAGSCGAGNVEAFLHGAAAQSDVTIYAQLLTASGGQTTDRYPEHAEVQYLEQERIRELFGRYPGTPADLAVFRLLRKPMPYTDAAGHVLSGGQAIVPQLTMKRGQVVYCQSDFRGSSGAPVDTDAPAAFVRSAGKGRKSWNVAEKQKSAAAIWPARASAAALLLWTKEWREAIRL